MSTERECRIPMKAALPDSTARVSRRARSGSDVVQRFRRPLPECGHPPTRTERKLLPNGVHPGVEGDRRRDDTPLHRGVHLRNRRSQVRILTGAFSKGSTEPNPGQHSRRVGTRWEQDSAVSSLGRGCPDRGRAWRDRASVPAREALRAVPVASANGPLGRGPVRVQLGRELAARPRSAFLGPAVVAEARVARRRVDVVGSG